MLTGLATCLLPASQCHLRLPASVSFGGGAGQGWARRKFLQEVWTAERLGVSLAGRRYLGLRLAGLRMGGAALLPSAVSLAGAAASPSALGGAGRRQAVPLVLIQAQLKLLSSGCSLWRSSCQWRSLPLPPPG